MKLTKKEFLELASEDSNSIRVIKFYKDDERGIEGRLKWAEKAHLVENGYVVVEIEDKNKRKKSNLPNYAYSVEDAVLAYEWRSGGISGGSCWGGESHSVSGDAEPEFDQLDELLAKICPGITYLQYKKLIPLIQQDEYTRYEYYGNSATYTYKYIKLVDLYDRLVEIKLIDDGESE